MRTFIHDRFCLILVLLYLLIPQVVNGQKRNITGTVVDVTGLPITGATVKISDSPSIGTITDVDGKFTLQAEGNTILEISFIGYTTRKVTSTSSPMHIVLEEAAQKLNEVVVVGYGIQKKVNLTGAVEQVGSEVFENRSVASVTQALQGSVPNLNITLEDGKPSRTATFNVRGTGSIGQGGNALVLIDGVEGDPSLLNPNDIASVSVLKDAASASIYGARGSFGVVLITTKNATKGKTTINYTGNFSMQSPTNTPDYVTDGVIWAEHFRNAHYNYNQALPTSMNNGQQAYSEEWLAEFKRRKAAGITDEVEVNPDGSYVYYANTDWYDLLYKDQTFAQDHNVTISGGSEKSDFYISGRFYDYKGLYNYNPDTYKSMNLRAKASLQVFDWLRVNNNMEFSNTDHHNPMVINSAYTVQRYIELTSFPSMPIYNPDGSYTRPASHSIGGFIDGNNYQDRNNRMLKNTTAFSVNLLDNKMHINGDFTFRYKTYDSLKKRAKVPYSQKENVFVMNGSYNNITEANSTTMYTATNLYADYETTLNNAHYLKGMIGYNYETSKLKSLSVDRNGLLLPDANSIDLALGDAITLSQDITNWRILGLFFRANYAYKDRYLFEVNGRYDGSSKFPQNQQYAFFPSFSAGWRLSEEPFWKVNDNILSNTKIRISYGSLGNGNVAPYSYMELLAIKTSGRVIEGTKPSYTSAPAVIPNSLTWETATTTDIGLDFSMMNGHLQFSGDYYIRKTKNMYTVGPTLPDVFGATSPKGNYADMTTRGWEISLNYKNQFILANKPFNYEIKATLHDYISKIDRYNNATKSLDDYYEGQTLGELWGYKTDGLFQSDAETEGYVNTIVKSSVDGVWRAGDLKFVDLNNNGKIDYGKNTADDHGDKVILGNSEPRYIYSFTLSGDWNNFFASVFFQGIGKKDWFPGTESPFWGQYNRAYNSLPSWHLGNYWTEETPNAYLPRYATYNSALGWGNTITDRYIQNVAYLRLKNLQIGYTLPQSLVSKMNLSNIRVYITGENLFCWSPLYKLTKDFDASTVASSKDSDLSSNNMGAGNTYPLMKSLSLGLSVTF